MHDALRFVMCALLVGAIATAFMDIVAVFRKRLFNVPAADYGLVGRWLAYLAHGRFRHNSIAAAPPVRGELVIGWSAHYLVGTVFAALLLAIWGIDWICRPTIGPALIVGAGSVVAPYFIMQPGMGLGIAASRTPHPVTARIRSLIAHTIFGTGLYVAGLVTSFIAARQWTLC